MKSLSGKWTAVSASAAMLVLAVVFVLRGAIGDEQGTRWEAPRYGISSRYPGDIGIADDSSVVFH